MTALLSPPSAQTAIITEDGRRVSYHELHELVGTFASKLVPRSTLIILGENDLASLVCYLAALEAGAIPLLLRANIPADQLDPLIQRYEPAYLFKKTGQQTHAGYTASHVLQGYQLEAADQAERYPVDDELALLMTTSGSTGSPKLVRLSLNNLISNAASICRYLAIEPGQRAVTSLPFGYSYGLSVINTHLMAGATVVLTEYSMVNMEFWKLVNEAGITSLAGVPFSYEMLLRLRFGRMDLPSIRTMTQAGGRLAPEKISQVYEICQAKHINFFTMYGQTEATARISYLPTEETLRKLGSIGIAIPGGSLSLTQSGPGADSHELIYSGPNVSLGYAESIDDLNAGDVNQGTLHTGDLARVDEEGFYFIEGRISRFLKIFGNRVSLDGVEQFVSQNGIICAAHGTDDQLEVHLERVDEARAESIQHELADWLKINRRAIHVHSIDSLPRLDTGKIDYPCLNQMT